MGERTRWWLTSYISQVRPETGNADDSIGKIFNKEKNKEFVDPKTGWKISPDRAGNNSHGGSAWSCLKKMETGLQR